MGRIGLATGSGRCGTNFLAKLFKEPGVIESSHERFPLSDTFHRYCQWYGVPVDSAGFINHRRSAIEKDLQSASYSFEASPFIALSLDTIIQAFDCRVIAMVRNPLDVVSSYISKNWYREKEVREQPDLPPSFQKADYFHHFLGRPSPIGEEFVKWNGMSRVGKLAWYWAAINRRLMEAAERNPDTIMVVKLEELDFGKAREVRSFLQMPGELDRHRFESLTEQRPNRLPHVHPPHAWSDEEWHEFEGSVSELAASLGYSPERPAADSSASMAPVRAPRDRVDRPGAMSFGKRLRVALSVMRRGSESKYLEVSRADPLRERI